jgi:sugar lactone lactonase YvrE
MPSDTAADDALYKFEHLSNSENSQFKSQRRSARSFSKMTLVLVIGLSAMVAISLISSSTFRFAAYAAADAATNSLIIPATFGPGSANGQFQSPVAVAVDGSGNIYVVDSQTAHVQVFDPSGKFLSVIGSGSGGGNGQFNYPYGIAIDNSGNIYVQDNLNARIQKFDPTGKFLLSFGSSGSSNGQFRSLAGIAVDGSGNVYVVDSALDRVQKFDPNGQVKLVFGSFASNKFDPTGVISGGKFDGPRGVAVDNSGNIYVADTGNDRVQKFDPNGRFLLLFGGPGSAAGQFDTPDSVATDSTGNVYVLDSGNDRIEKFDSNGKFISAFGSAGYQGGSGKFLAPSNIAVDSSGKVYVADTGNYRVQVISFSQVASTTTPEFPVPTVGALVAALGIIALLGRTGMLKTRQQ